VKTKAGETRMAEAKEKKKRKKPKKEGTMKVKKVIEKWKI